MLVIILTSHYHFIIMCLENYEPVELPTFDLAVPYENHKGTCNYIETEHLDSLSPHVSDLRFLHLNIRGLISKQHQLYNLLTDGFGTAKSIDIAMLNKIWLRKENINKISLPGFTFISKERVGKKGRGVAIIVANRYKCRR